MTTPAEPTNEIDTPGVPAPVSHGPDWTFEGWDDDHDRPTLEGARWDLTWECAIGIWHDHEFDGTPEHYSISVSATTDSASVGVSRRVTPEQIRKFARHLLAVVGDPSLPTHPNLEDET